MSHSTSEQAGQHIGGAWIMRTGFWAYGGGTLVAALLSWRNKPLVKASLAVFGLGLIGAAVWSNAPFLKSVPADLDEDTLHSVASAVVGTGFALASAARLFGPGGSRGDALAWAGLAISVLVPAAMAAFPAVQGLLQRVMFIFSFLFVLRETGLSVGPRRSG